MFLPSMSIITFIVLVLIATTFVAHCGPLADNDSLYHTTDNVIILTSDNFTQFVVDLHQDGAKLQLLQFYNSYCGHCISFAPKFKQFLHHTTIKWREVLSISVVDCSLSINSKVCRDYNVMYYPTLRMFWFKPTKDDTGQDVKLNGQEVTDIRRVILKWITDNWKSGNIPPFFPDFKPLIADNKNALIQSLHLDTDNRTVLVVVESAGSFLGRELMMDFSAHTSQIRLYRMEEFNIRLLDQILPQTLDNFKLPFLLTINRHEQEFKVIPKPLLLVEELPSITYFTNVIRTEFLKNVPVTEEVLDSGESGVTEVKNELVKYSRRVYISDLNNALRTALFHEIPMRKQFTLEQLNALSHFLSVLYDNYHFQQNKTRQFVKHMNDWLVKKLNDLKQQQQQQKNDNPVLDTADLVTTMNMYEEYYHFPEIKSWRACADVLGGSGSRRYPCSLWTLFHVLTVAEYRRSLQLKQWSSLHPTLYAMREYIQHFFGCTECSKHFTSMAAGLENELTYPNSSILWLWHAHNKVNARLKGSQSENPKLPKRQFPTYEECDYCYNATPDPLQYKDATNYRKYYNEQKLLEFLVHYYSAENLVPDMSEYQLDEAENHEQHELRKSPNDGLNHHQQAQNMLPSGGGESKKRIALSPFAPFTSTDYSIIIIFYLVSIVLLVSLYAFFRSRNKSRGISNRRYFPSFA